MDMQGFESTLLWPYLYHSNGSVVSNWSQLDNISDYNDYDPYDVWIFPENRVIPILFGLSLVAGLVGNGLVVFVVLWQSVRRSPDVSNMYFMNLAVADILYLVFCVPSTAITYLLPYWPFGKALCKAANFFLVVAMTTSVLTITAMGIDRYQAIVRPQHAKRRRTVGRTVFVLVTLWLVNCVAAGPTLLTARVKQTNWPVGEERTYCTDRFSDPALQRAHTLSMCLLYYLVPLIVITMAYSAVAGHLARAAHVTEGTPGRIRGRMSRRRRKVIRIMLTVVITFGLCWLPLHVLQLLLEFGHPGRSYAFYVIQIGAHTCSYINSAINPLIYSFASKPFRKSFRETFRCCRTCRYMWRRQRVRCTQVAIQLEVIPDSSTNSRSRSNSSTRTPRTSQRRTSPAFSVTMDMECRLDAIVTAV